jgi:hypothetical protein
MDESGRFMNSASSSLRSSIDANRARILIRSLSFFSVPSVSLAQRTFNLLLDRLLRRNHHIFVLDIQP